MKKKLKSPLAFVSGICYTIVRLRDTRFRNDNRQQTKKDKKMKELKIGDWYYMMLGYGGSGSQYVNIRRKTGTQTGANMFSMFGGKGGGMRPLPVCDVFEAVAEDGVVHTVSANNLAANGHIGIGSLEEPKFGHVASIYRQDAELLVKTGRYTEEEITAAFPNAFKDSEEEADDNPYKTEPMTDKQEEILKAVHATNWEKAKREKEEADRKFRESVEAAKKELDYIPCKGAADGKWLSCGEKRRNLLAVLKHEFPGVKFSVRTRNGSTSDSVTVEYEDGPAKGKVEKIVNQFETTKYNAYEDCHEPTSTAYSVVCGGFDYAFVERKYSKEVYKYITEWLFANVGGMDNECASSTAIRVKAKTSFPNGGYELDGMVLDENGWHLVVKAKEEPKKPTPPDAPKGNGGGVEVTENKEKGGIEIRFPSMPSETIRNYMKANGWRWTRYNGGCWYNRATDENRKVAAEVVAMWDKENGRASA